MDTFVCAACDKTWHRKPTKGRVPRLCPECRPQSIGKKLARCAWCDHLGFIRHDADCCSRQCAMNMRARKVSPLTWTSCLVCMSWFTKMPHLYGTCSTACQSIAVEVMAPAVRKLEDLECPTCAVMFTPRCATATYCGARCQKKTHRQRRRVREAGTYGEWRWSDFMRVARRFDYCCAYCGVKPDGLDPDHVVPLSRGGHNVVSNLLPACKSCNSDKRDLLLSEWPADRERRGLPPRATTWAEDDSRYYHLTFVRSTLTCAV